jgi:hypothetical protein
MTGRDDSCGGATTLIDMRSAISLSGAWSRLVLAGFWLLIAASTFLRPDCVWAQVAPRTDAVTVKTEDAAVADLLARRSVQLGLRIDASNGLDLVVSANSRWRVAQVLTRILVGCDYVANIPRIA